MTCIEARVPQVFHIAHEQFPSAVREVPLEEYKLHFAPRTGEGYKVLEELLPERGIHPQGLLLHQRVVAGGIGIEFGFLRAAGWLKTI